MVVDTLVTFHSCSEQHMGYEYLKERKEMDTHGFRNAQGMAFFNMSMLAVRGLHCTLQEAVRP